MKFIPGTSGNYNGRPKGSKDRRTIFRELVEDHKEALVKKAVELALAGNEQMLRLLLDRLLPAKPREEPLQIETALEGSLTEQGRTILSLITEGQITMNEGASLLQALGTQVKLLETDELIRRIKKLEEMSNDPKV